MLQVLSSHNMLRRLTPRQTHYYFNISLKKQVLYKVDIGHIQKDDVMCLICITLFTFNWRSARRLTSYFIKFNCLHRLFTAWSVPIRSFTAFSRIWTRKYSVNKLYFTRFVSWGFIKYDTITAVIVRVMSKCLWSG